MRKEGKAADQDKIDSNDDDNYWDATDQNQAAGIQR